MNGNMMGNMNPMQQMFWNMMQNGMGGQQMPGMRGGSMDCDEFEDCLEKYCREVANGRREFPRAFKSLVKKAWHGAKEAMSGRGRYDDTDDNEDEDDYFGSRQGKRHGKGKGFWKKIGKLNSKKSNIMQLNEEMMRCFPNASPEEQNEIRKMALEYSDERRKLLSKLMQDDEDEY